jgi:hypothetical protein
VIVRLGKSFVVYTRVYVEGDLVDCIYFMGSKCWANPFAEKKVSDLTSRTLRKMSVGPHESVGENIEFYEPSQDEKKDYCLNIKNFRECPRFKAYQDDLKFRGLQKEEHP